MVDPGQDPVSELREEVAQLRDALRNLRESVVLRVMRRNELHTEATQAEQRVEAMARGITLAIEANEPESVAQFTQEHTLRMEERERLRALLTQAEAEAEAAKMSLPEDEATILRMINNAQLQAVQRTAMQVKGNGTDSFGANADDLWERASSKIATMRSEAAASEEAGSTQSPQTSREQEAPLSPAPDIEQMLADLESRLPAKSQN